MSKKNKTSNYVRTICEIGIFAAIGFVLDELQGIISKGVFANGGSIGFAMIAVLIIGYRRGWLPAILTGLIMGTLDIATSAYILHPAQLFLDYILPYALVGVGCIFKTFFDKSKTKSHKILWLIVGTVVGGALKFLSHYLAGVIFWANPENFAWGLTSLNPYLYCFIYNIAFMEPSIVMTGALIVAMYLRAPTIFGDKFLAYDKKTTTTDEKPLYGIVFSSVIDAVGTFCFIWFLIDYIKSFSDYHDEGAYGYDFNQDSMIITVLAFFLIILAVFSIIYTVKHRYSRLFSAIYLTIIVSQSWTYGVARLIRMYVKKKDPTMYWIWFAIGLATILASATLIVLAALDKRKKTIEANQSA